MRARQPQASTLIGGCSVVCTCVHAVGAETCSTVFPPSVAFDRLYAPLYCANADLHLKLIDPRCGVWTAASARQAIEPVQGRRTIDLVSITRRSFSNTQDLHRP